MGATTLDIRLSRPLSPRAFSEAELARIDLEDADEARDQTRRWEPGVAIIVQKWRVARVHLSERLGLPFRCQVLMTREEPVAPDPSIPPAQQKTWFDKVSDMIGNDDPNAPDLMDATDQMADENLWNNPSPGNPFGSLGGLPAAIGDTANDMGDLIGGMQGPD